MRKLVVVGFVACLIAVDILATSTLWFRELHVQEQRRSEALKSQISDLQTTKSSLVLENEDLLVQRQNLEDDVNTLENEKNLLETEMSNLELQVDQAYDDGYLQGVIDGVGTGFNIRDPTYQEALDFITLDQTDQNEYDEDSYYCFHFTADVEKNAFDQGYRCGLVYMEFVDGCHSIVCFNTIDHDLIFIEPQDDEIVTLTIGQQYWDRSKYEPTYDDRILDYVIVW